MSSKVSPVLVIHGGAGIITRANLSAEKERDYRAALKDFLRTGMNALKNGASALDAATLVVTLFEDSPLFNAGRGAVYTSAATHEMDASVMNGPDRAAGAVACVHGVKNPILAARAVMEHSPHVLMVAGGAMDFLRKQGIAFEPESYFHVQTRLDQLHKLQAQNPTGMALDHDVKVPDTASENPPASPPANPPLDESKKMGTVGCIALDSEGRLAAATSTGGMTNKLPGRVGDTPVIGAGCYADDTVAVSCTGTGEIFIRLCVGQDISARMRYLGRDLKTAGQEVMDEVGRLGGSGGLIALDSHGNLSLPFNAEGMYRGYILADGEPMEAIYGDAE